MNKVFNFHLFEFTRTENKISWSDFVAKGFTDLRHSKRNTLSACSDHVWEIHKHRLSCLRSEVGNRGRIFFWSKPGLHHQVKGGGLTPFFCLTTWARCRGKICARRNQVICTETFVTFLTLNERI